MEQLKYFQEMKKFTIDSIKMAENEMSRADLRKKADIAPNTMAKLVKNEYVAMPVLDKLCDALGADYGDIMTYIQDRDENKNL